MTRIIFAAAGTAGHVEPALAVARWIREQKPEVKCEFLISDAGVESSLLRDSGFASHVIAKAAMPRKISLDTLRWPLIFLKALRQTRNVVSGSSLVVGFGGYVCAPAYVVARSAHVPTIAHEANVLPGWANRLGVRLGATPLLAFAATYRVDPRFAKGLVVGMPLRESVYLLSEKSAGEIAQLRVAWMKSHGLDPSKKLLLIFGGSLGSQGINAVVAEVLPELLLAGIQVVHVLGGKNQLPEEMSGYRPFSYLSNLPEVMAMADLIIARSGAVTCAELIALNKYALLVPLEIGNGEQKFNASELESAGLASVISNSAFTARYISANILKLLKVASEKREISATHHPHAVEAIGYELLRQAGER